MEQIEIRLIPAPEEGSFTNPEFQTALENFCNAVPRKRTESYVFDSADAGGGLTGVFTILMQNLPDLLKGLAAYHTAKAFRKVSVSIQDGKKITKITAGSMEEIKDFLEARDQKKK